MYRIKTGGLAAVIVSGVIAAGAAPSTLAAEAGIGEYFWPNHHESMRFKVRSHGLNGVLSVSRQDTVVIDGKEYLEVRRAPKGYPARRESVYLRADDKAIYARYSKQADAPEVMELSVPIAVGTAWQTVDRDGNVSTRKITAIAPCKTREGLAFEHCVRVDYRWRELGAVSFFSPQNGEVIYSGNNGFFNRRLLEK